MRIWNDGNFEEIEKIFENIACVLLVNGILLYDCNSEIKLNKFGYKEVFLKVKDIEIASVIFRENTKYRYAIDESGSLSILIVEC